MNEVARMIVGLGIDMRDYERGLEVSVAAARAAAKRIADAAPPALPIKPPDAGAAARAAQKTAADMVAALKTSFAQQQAVLREQMARGTIDATQFKARGAEAAQAFNRGLLSVISELRAKQILAPAQLVAITNEFKQAGAAAGAALAVGTRAGAGAATSVRRVGDAASFSADKLHNLATGAAFTFGQIASGAVTADGGLHTILRSLAGFSSFLGTKGVIVSGFLAAADAAVSFWRRAEEASAKARKALEDDILRLANAGDSLGLQQKMSDLFNPQPAAALADRGLFKNMTEVERLRTHGIASLERELAVQRQLMQEAGRAGQGRFFDFTAARFQIANILEALAPLREQYDLLLQAQVSLGRGPKTVTGLAPVAVTALGPEALARAAEEAHRKMLAAIRDDVQDTLSRLDFARAFGGPLSALTDLVLAKFDAIRTRLAGVKDQTSDVAGALREAFSDIAKLDFVEVLRLGKPITVEVRPLIDRRVPPKLPPIRLPTRLELGEPLRAPALPPAAPSRIQRVVADAGVALRTAGTDITAFTARHLAGMGLVTRLALRFGAAVQQAGNRALLFSDRVHGPLAAAAGAAALALGKVVSVAARFGVSLVRFVGDMAGRVLSALSPLTALNQAFNDAFGALTPIFDRLKGPASQLAAILAEALTPIVAALAPAMRELLPVIRAILQTVTPIIVALIPLLKVFAALLEAVFPIIKAVAIAFTYVAQVAFTVGAALLDVVAVIAKGFGYIIKAISTAIDKIPFVDARGGIKAGQGLIDFGRGLNDAADGLRDSAKEMGKARDDIKKVKLGDDLTGLGNAARDATHALANLPSGYKLLQLRLFQAMDPRLSAAPPSAGGAGIPAGAGGGGNTVVFEGDVIIQAAAGDDGESLYRQFRETLMQKARRGGAGAMELALALPA